MLAEQTGEAGDNAVSVPEVMKCGLVIRES